MLPRQNGATLAEIMDKMGRQKHTARGFMVSAIKKAGHQSYALAKVEQVSYEEPQSFGQLLQHFKRWRIPAFDQAQEVNGDPYQFGELFLRQLLLLANRQRPLSELLSEGWNGWHRRT